MATPTTKNQTTEIESLRREVEQLRAELADSNAKLANGDALSLPFVPLPEDYDERILRNLDIRLTEPHKIKIRAIFTALEAQGAKLADGKPVYLPHHAVLWLLDNIKLTGRIPIPG